MTEEKSIVLENLGLTGPSSQLWIESLKVWQRSKIRRRYIMAAEYKVCLVPSETIKHLCPQTQWTMLGINCVLRLHGLRDLLTQNTTDSVSGICHDETTAKSQGSYCICTGVTL